MNSLQRRLNLVSAAALVACAALVGLGAERTLRASLLAAQEDKLRGLTFALIGEGEPEGDGFTLESPERLDPRLAAAEGALFAAVIAPDGRPLWSSPSFPLQTRDFAPQFPGRWSFEKRESPDEPPSFRLAFGVEWVVGKRKFPMTVVVQERGDAYALQLARFRGTLLRWIGFFTLMLLIVESWIVRRGFRPLRAFAAQLARIRAGEAEEIKGTVPSELIELRDGMNTLLRHERGQRARYRHALDDLAHSLKTPLAVIKAAGEKGLAPQIDRMDEIIRFQLQRAGTAGRKTFAPPVAARPVADRIAGALAKVYRDKNLRVENEIPANLTLRMDTGDLTELLGNVLDNAGKYGRGRARIRAGTDGTGHFFAVEDDGPGFPADTRAILARGVRGDSQTEGQGIGLAMVDEMVQIYEGSIALERSPDLGGARVVVHLPL